MALTLIVAHAYNHRSDTLALRSTACCHVFSFRVRSTIMAVKKLIWYPPPFVIATQRYGINAVPAPTVA